MTHHSQSLVALVMLTATLATRSHKDHEPSASAVANGPLMAAPQSAETAVPVNPLKEAYFGEQHIHTAYSLDAYIGGTRLPGARRSGTSRRRTDHASF